MHELLEGFYKGEKTADQVKTQYLVDFGARVKARAPNSVVFKNYFSGGFEYLKNLCPSGNKILSVESKLEFLIGSVPVVGYIDLVEEDGNGEIVLTDHKSKILKQRSGRQKPTKSDAELDAYLRQLYLYSRHVLDTYGRPPGKLRFNCFREQTVIEEPFDLKAYDRAIRWFLDAVSAITAETDFNPRIEPFKCRYLCEMRDVCDYYRLYKG